MTPKGTILNLIEGGSSDYCIETSCVTLVDIDEEMILDCAKEVARIARDLDLTARDNFAARMMMFRDEMERRGWVTAMPVAEIALGYYLE